MIATYHGTVVLDIPVTTLLAGHEAEIRAAAAQGLSPHDSGSNTNSDIALTVSVPKAVTVGTSRAKSTSSMLAYTSFSPGDDRTQVTANIQLKDLTWQQLLDIYDAEKADPGQHTIKVQVPYAVGTTDPTEATRLASEQVTVTGQFNFFASATTPAQVFHFDTKTLALAQSPTDCFASAPTRTTRWVDEEDGHDLQPSKTGPNFFQAAGIPDYEFSTWELSSDRLTGIYKYKKVFGALPVNGDDPEIDTDFKVGLDGGAPAQKEEIHAENKDSLLTIENVVHLDDLRGGRIAKLLEKYDETPNAFDDIALKNAHLGFTTQIDLPAQLKFSDPSAISVTGLPHGFSAKTVAVSGQTATITVDFDNPDEITTIAALKDAMGALHGDAVITISKIAFTDAATADTDYQIDHLTQGVISVDVEKQLGGINLYDDEHVSTTLVQVNVALHAHVLLQRDVHYIVRGDEVKLIDASRGRVAELQRWPDGLQAAVEAKEGVPISEAGEVLDTITVQALIGRYSTVCGMTGTAIAAGEQFRRFYDLAVSPIEPNTPCIRVDEKDRVYDTAASKRT
ncbi:MAG: hypothetical protein KH140_09730, partial [Actinomyces sp.]|nr:hypothetical protein [Actinomyces sp.]